jgi:outer membrane protein OmpA-like peptidoglycan-associated protein
VPTNPPPPPVLPPPIAVPTRPVPPPPPVTVVPEAPGGVATLANGVRITFGNDRADLNAITDSAVRGLAHTVPADATFNVTAYATGSPDDPSSARRLSLSRALVVRSALMGEGVASVRIYVKALGAASPSIADGPPDRVDVVASEAPGTASPPQTPPTAAAPPDDTARPAQ